MIRGRYVTNHFYSKKKLVFFGEQEGEKGMVASKPFPVFNLGRQDLPHVVLIGAFSAAAALALRAGEGGSPGPDKSAWRGLTIILCTLSAIVMSGLALAKVIAPFFHESLGGGLFQGYTQLEEGSGRADAPVVETRSVRPQQAAAPSTEKREIEQPSSRPVSEAVRSSRASYRASYSPREEEDIECGLLLEASAVDFEYNGVRHQKGALRVIKVERDGVCEVSPGPLHARGRGVCVWRELSGHKA